MSVHMCQKDEDNISKSLQDAWDEEIIKDLVNLDKNKLNDYDGIQASKPQNEQLLIDTNEDETYIAGEQLLINVNEDETYIAAVSTIPPGFEHYVNATLIIAMYNLHCNEIIK